MFIPAVITMVAVFASIYNKKIFYVRNGIIYYKENSLRLFSVVIIFYVLSGIYALTKTRKKLGIKQYIFMQTWNIVIICFLGLYYLPKKKLMLIYYCVAVSCPFSFKPCLYFINIHNIITAVICYKFISITVIIISDTWKIFVFVDNFFLLLLYYLQHFYIFLRKLSTHFYTYSIFEL